MDEDDCEQLARALIYQSGLDDRPRATPFAFAQWAEVNVQPDPGCIPYTADGIIFYSPSAAEDATAYFVAHELGHVMVRRSGARLDRWLEERCASRIASALLLPSKAFKRDLWATGWDLAAMRSLWPLASAWVIARRVTELREEAAAMRVAGRRREKIREIETERSRLSEGGSLIVLGVDRELTH